VNRCISIVIQMSWYDLFHTLALLNRGIALREGVAVIR
jgi:hypothetical protein